MLLVVLQLPVLVVAVAVVVFVVCAVCAVCVVFVVFVVYVVYAECGVFVGFVGCVALLCGESADMIARRQVVLRLNSNRKIHLLPYYPDLFPYLPGNETTGTPPLMAIRPEHISVGQYHNLLLMDNGALYVWGANYFGQLGLGDLRMRVMPTVVSYFVGRTDPAPHISPLDGLGRSIATRPRDAVTAQRRIKLAEAGEHHTVVVADCYGGGFKPDGSCDCKCAPCLLCFHLCLRCRGF